MMYIRRIALACALNASMALQAGPDIVNAATKGDLNGLRISVDSGQGVNEIDSHGWTPLMWAVYYRQISASKWLLEYGADPDARSTNSYKSYPKGSTALTIAAYEGLEDQIRLLVIKNAKIDLINEKGMSAIDYARKSGYHPILQPLGVKVSLDPTLDAMISAIEKGRSINAVDNFGWSPLMWAVYFQDLSTVTYLLKNGADPNLQATSPVRPLNPGATALIIAGYYGLTEMVAPLIQHKARLDLRDSKGKTAADLASEYGYSEFVNSLSDGTPIVGQYQKVIIEGITLGSEVPRNYAFLSEECKKSLLETLILSECFQVVEFTSPGKTYDTSTLRIKTKIVSVNSDGTRILAKISLINAATDKLERELVLASIDGTGINFSISFNKWRYPLGKNTGEDLGATIARKILTLTNKSITRVIPIARDDFEVKTMPPTFRAEGFHPSLLFTNRTAILPIENANLGLSIAEYIYLAIGGRAQYFGPLSDKLVSLVQKKSKDKIINLRETKPSIFGGYPFQWQNLLLSPQKQSSTDVSEKSPFSLFYTELDKTPILQGVRYLVIPQYFRSQKIIYYGERGGGCHAKIVTSLQLGIIDVLLKKLVWASVFNSTTETNCNSSAMIQPNEMQKIEEDLLDKIESALKPIH